MPETHRLKKGIWFAPLLSIGSIFFIFRGLHGVTFNLRLLKIDWLYIAGGFLALAVVWCSKAYRMYVITKGMGGKVRFFRFFQIYLATCFISHITPFSSGGTPLEIYLIYKQGISLGKATAVTAVDLGLNTLMFFILVPVALLANIKALKGFNTLNSGMFMINWPVIIFSVCLLALIFWKRSYLLRFIEKIKLVSRWRAYINERGWFKHIHHEWKLFQESWLLLVKENPASIILAIIASLIYWTFYLLLAPMILWAIRRPVAFFNLLGWQLLFNFAQILIPTPGGSGGSELILTYLFKNLTGAAAIGVFVLFWRVYTFFSTLILGGFFFLRLTRDNVDPPPG